MPESFKKFENPNLDLAERLVEEYLTFFKPLDHTRRYGNQSGAWVESMQLNQSITEHMAGMSYLAEIVFERDRALLDTLDKDRVRKMIHVHDMHEGHIDDVVYKTDERRAEEAEWDKVISDAYSHGGDVRTGQLISEYNEKLTDEAKFVKALDHLEALLTILYADRVDKISNREEYTENIILSSAEISPLISKVIHTVSTRLSSRRSEIGQGELDLRRK